MQVKATTLFTEIFFTFCPRSPNKHATALGPTTQAVDVATAKSSQPNDLRS